MTKPFDIAVIGGGIVGLATADAIRRARPDLSLTVLEKEPEVAVHQTGRNSGVIHAGLYYAPGSLKARLCTEGAEGLFRYCAERGIPTTRTGKIVVATSRDQLTSLAELERRGTANGVAMQRIGPGGIAEIEPHARGVEALHVPATGAVDFGDVARAFAADLSRAGHRIRTGFEVREARRSGHHTVLAGPPGDITASVVVNCAGLHVDRVMRILGHKPDLKVLPFRGEYWGLSETAAGLVRGHIYPVRDPRLPHLGVHFTRNVTGCVELGPNAVWAWGREAYGRFSARLPDALEALSYRGFRRLAQTHWRTAVEEQWRSLHRRSVVRKARAMLPELEMRHLDKWRSGLRAQAVDTDGALIHDFVIREGPGVVNVLNAPSPAATACLAIGGHIAQRALSQVA
ncbi:L-2-hydroxyglutarate oxidase [Candidatus Palauibacter sp.]|uniref:L-2-hydroxyglutarate oxidase n=1 Tax=Candidatus Palauibacter sp. TaxID=3101350 RepID=UPI003B51B5CA